METVKQEVPVKKPRLSNEEIVKAVLRLQYKFKRLN